MQPSSPQPELRGARRRITLAVAIGVVTVLGNAVIAYYGRAPLDEMGASLPRGALLGLLVGGLLVSLALLYHGYGRAHRAAIEAAEARRFSERLYRDLYDKTPVMMHSIDAEGRLVSVNEFWLRTLGYSEDEVLGRPVTDFYTPSSRRYAEAKALPSFFAEGHIEDVPYRMPTRDGRVLDVLLSATAEQDASGRLVRSRAMLVDVTALRRAEADREAVIRELERSNAELKNFTYTVSHDLKSPLVTIQGFLGFLRKDFEAQDRERFGADLGRIQEATDRMRELLDALLEIARLGHVIHPPEDVSLATIAAEAGELVAGPLAEHGVELEIDPDLPRRLCDRVRMRQVFQNLIENAAKFMGDPPRPRISIGRRQGDGGEEIVVVRDNGQGLEPEHCDAVFELFRKLSPESPGSGLGLALVRRVVELHGGRVWIESEGPGTGCAVCFTLTTAPRPDGGKP